MEIKQQIDRDLKAAMLSGQKQVVSTLRGLKSTILYAEVESNKRSEGLNTEELVSLIGKEANKRQESADLYTQGGSPERAELELAEKSTLEAYLPPQLSEIELVQLIATGIEETGAESMKNMGQVIAWVKAKAAGAADGGTIARLVKERLEK